MGNTFSTETTTSEVTVDLDADKGWVKGSVMSDASGHTKCQRFLNIPYAQPPIGELRFKRPAAFSSTHQYAVDGTRFGNICSQPSYLLNGVAEPLFDVKYTEEVGNAYHGPRFDPADLLDDEGGVKCCVVAVSYRLNLFGFLASKELRDESGDGSVGNYGFHDQRAGLEWTHRHIAAFGGNPDNITLGGLSAGAYSAHFQLAYEFNFPVEPIVKRVVMHSNAIASQPKTVEESQLQFDQLLEYFGISLELTGPEKLAELRAIPDETFAKDILKLGLHTFRAVTDGHFVHPDTFSRICDGNFAAEFGRRNLSMVIGEVENEENLYREINHPSTVRELVLSLENYYPTHVVENVLPFYKIPPPVPEPSVEEVKEAYGVITADGQVYVSERLLIKALEDGGVPASRLLRYRIKWRGSFMEKYTPARMGVAHAHDSPLWWFTKRAGMDARDVAVCRAWLAPFRLFMEGKHDAAAEKWWEGKPAGGVRPVRMLTPSGDIVVADDDRWARTAPIAVALASA